MRAITLLTWWRIRNSLRTTMSDPRKLFGVIVLILWLGASLFLFNFASSKGSHGATPGDPVGDPLLIQCLAKISFIVLAFVTLDINLSEYVLAYKMPDLDYLFPSPISRKVVIAARIPAMVLMTALSSGFGMFILRVLLTPLGMPDLRMDLSTWAALFCAVGVYKNIGTSISLRVPERKRLRGGFGIICVVLIGLFALLYFRGGLAGLQSGIQNPILRAIFYPFVLASDTLAGPRPTLIPLGCFGLWLVSFVPLFTTNANFYEQSLVSSEQLAVMRTAAKGGWSGLAASKAAKSKKVRTRSYTIPPFGKGAGAIFWAHLCAAAKRSTVNFIIPPVVGVLTGLMGVFFTDSADGLAATVIFIPVMYASMFFLNAGKSACDSAMRRREIIGPLPVKSWKVALANLGVPLFSMALFSFAIAATYGLGGGHNLAKICIGLGLVFPLRLAGRMMLQYIVALGFPDTADKMQQLMAQLFYYVTSLPFLFLELAFTLPAYIFGSVGFALVVNAIYQLGMLALMLYLAGIASDRSLASGEPVRFWSLTKREKAAERIRPAA